VDARAGAAAGGERPCALYTVSRMRGRCRNKGLAPLSSAVPVPILLAYSIGSGLAPAEARRRRVPVPV